MKPSVILYTRPGCHLCDDAKRILQQHGLSPQIVNIDQDPDLAERYRDCIPVVSIDGRERFRGRVDPLLLRRILDSRQAD